MAGLHLEVGVGQVDIQWVAGLRAGEQVGHRWCRLADTVVHVEALLATLAIIIEIEVRLVLGVVAGNGGWREVS